MTLRISQLVTNCGCAICNCQRLEIIRPTRLGGTFVVSWIGNILCGVPEMVKIFFSFFVDK